MCNRTSGVGLAAVLVVGLLVLAGCRLPATGAGPTALEGTVTPAPVVTDTAPKPGFPTPGSSTESGEIPGVRGSRVTDVDALLAAHERHLRTRSYTLVWSRRVGGEGPGVPVTTRQEVAVETDSRFRIRVTGAPADGERSEYVTFVDRIGVYRLADEPTVSPTGHTLARSIDARRLFARRPLPATRSLLRPDATTVQYVGHDGTRYARVVIRRTPPYLERTYDHDVREFSATVWVHPDGYLRSVYYQFLLVWDGGRATIRVRYSYVDVGTTAVTEPRWVERLKADDRLAPDRRSTQSPTPTPTLALVPVERSSRVVAVSGA